MLMTKLNSRIYIRFIRGNRNRKYGIDKTQKLGVTITNPFINMDDFIRYTFMRGKETYLRHQRELSEWNKETTPSHITDNIL